MENCTNCKASLKSGFFASTELIEKRKTDFINRFTNLQADDYCTKCSPDLAIKASSEWRSLNTKLNASLKELIRYIPVVTLQNPKDWDYQVLRMVTAQSVTGTGVVSEFASSFTDLFGMQSRKYNTKIKAGEDLCKAQLRLDAVSIGANAIIATDIDYAEVGGDKGMLMVCMSGTAIRLANPGILAEDVGEKFAEMDGVAKQLFDISKYAVYASENPY